MRLEDVKKAKEIAALSCDLKQKVAQAMTTLQSIVAAAERVFEFMDEEALGVACNTNHLRATTAYHFRTQLCAQI